MSSVLLLANIGKRDLRLDGQELRPARSEGERILAELAQQHREHLEWPLLAPVLRYLAEHEGEVDLCLFATNQPDFVEQRFRQNDTIHFARCLQQLLQGQKPVRTVRVQEITDPPHLYDQMFRFFEQQLSSSKIKRFLEGYQKVYVSLAGGVPACNMALLFHAVAILADRCIPIYPWEGQDTAYPLQIGRQLQRREAIQTALGLLERRDYAGVSYLLRERLQAETPAKLAESAVARLNFDFGRAARLLEKLIADDLEGRRYYQPLRQEVVQLQAQGTNWRPLIAELYSSLRLKWEREEYLDFLMRTFRFQEAVLRQIVEDAGISTDKGETGKFERFQETIAGSPALSAYLGQQTVEGTPLKCNEPNIPCLIAIIRFLVEHEQLHQWQGILPFMEDLQQLAGLRNRSLPGHGFAGVSRDTITNLVPDPLGKMSRTLEILGIQDHDSYRQLHQSVVESIQML